MSANMASFFGFKTNNSFKRLTMNRLSGFLILAVMLTLSSCSSISTNEKVYTEKFSSVLISSDQKDLVVLGMQYHYVFKPSKRFIEAINSDFKRSVIGHVIDDFDVAGQGKTFGYFRLQLVDNASESDVRKALETGFSRDEKTGMIYLTEALDGTRYSAKEFKTPFTETTLNRTYSVQVKDHQSSADTLQMLTPVIYVIGIGFTIANPAVLLLPVAVCCGDGK